MSHASRRWIYMLLRIQTKIYWTGYIVCLLHIQFMVTNILLSIDLTSSYMLEENSGFKMCTEEDRKILSEINYIKSWKSVWSFKWVHLSLTFIRKWKHWMGREITPDEYWASEATTALIEATQAENEQHIANSLAQLDEPSFIVCCRCVLKLPFE